MMVTTTHESLTFHFTVRDYSILYILYCTLHSTYVYCTAGINSNTVFILAAECEPKCQHGACTGINNCTCEKGYTGKICETRECCTVLYCTVQ